MRKEQLLKAPRFRLVTRRARELQRLRCGNSITKGKVVKVYEDIATGRVDGRMDDPRIYEGLWFSSYRR